MRTRWAPSAVALLIMLMAYLFSVGQRLTIFIWVVIPIALLLLMYQSGYTYFALRYLLPAFIPISVFVVAGLNRTFAGQSIAAVFVCFILWGNFEGQKWYATYPYHPTPISEMHNGQGEYSWASTDRLYVDPQNALGPILLSQLAWELAFHNKGEIRAKQRLIQNEHQTSESGFFPLSFIDKYLVYNPSAIKNADWVFVPSSPFAGSMIVNVFPWWNKPIRIFEQQWRRELKKSPSFFVNDVNVIRTYGGAWVDLRSLSDARKIKLLAPQNNELGEYLRNNYGWQQHNTYGE